MNPSIFALSILTLCVSFAAAHGQADLGTPPQQFSAIFKQYSRLSGGLRAAKTDLERKVAVERIAPFASKFVELAEKYPDDPVALTALRQAVQIVASTDSAALQAWEINDADFPTGNRDGSTGRTVDVVLGDHLLSDKLGPVIDRMRYAYRMEYEKCLSALLEKNPHRDIQGLACLALAQFLQDRLHMLRLVEDRPELVECYEIAFGKNYLSELQRLGQEKLGERTEALFERAVGDYGDVKFRSGTIGEIAKSALYDIRHLGIGKIAPNIEGKDQDGVPFQLSDYRGKVVLLYFWSEYCLPCRTTWPHDRSLVTDLKEKPFALIGVNYFFGSPGQPSPRHPGELKNIMAKEKINWRTFDDEGAIYRQWNFPATPTMYIIDREGAIRHKWIGKVGEKAIDSELEKLIEEAEQAATAS